MESELEQKRKETAARLRLDPHEVPRHVAIIMDGNGRWATEKGLPRLEGYSQGAKTIERISRYCVGIGIEYLTIFSFSMQNWKRCNEEVAFIMYLHTEYLRQMKAFLMKYNIRLVHLGRKAKLPQAVVAELTEAIRLTSRNTGMVLGLALNYGARSEITDAAIDIVQKCEAGRLRIKSINQQQLSDRLYTAGWHDPDLLIRTSGEMRVSNFLLWQIAYTVLYFADIYWPDFSENHLKEAIRTYAERSRQHRETNA